MADYDPNDLSKFSHLTNNCVAKKYIENSDKKKKTRDPSGEAAEVSDDDEDTENIWSLDDFKENLKTSHGEKYKDETEDIYQDIIYP